MAVVPVLLAPLGCRVPHLLKRGRGCGFPGLLGRLCEAWKGKRFVIARRFDQVSGTHSWVRTDTCLLKESFHLVPTPLGKLMPHRGWARPLALPGGPSTFMRTEHRGKLGSVVPKGPSAPSTGTLWGQRGGEPGLGTGSHAWENQAGTPPHPHRPAGTASSSLPAFPMMPDRDSTGSP